MGIFLNSPSAYTLYKSETKTPYFVDKTRMLAELMPLVEEGNKYICITRPRRFGKTVMANMISSFFSNACDASDIFDELYIAEEKNYQKYRNQHNVIHITFSETPRRCTNYNQYIERIERILITDLKEKYPDVTICEQDAIWDVLQRIQAVNRKEKYIFVLDEWDFIFHQDFAAEADKEEYLTFLRNLLKDKSYVSLAYMTGILPIAKYSSGSELNMFLEYTMATKAKYAEYFGFTEEEVDQLYQKYKSDTLERRVSREGLRDWYDGYCTLSGARVYNPRSVVCALRDNQLSSYWTSSGPYDEIFYYVKNNIAEVREALVLMVSGTGVPAKVEEYAAVSRNLQTKNEIFSAMVVYGFLSYSDGKVKIPNRELMNKFMEMLYKEESLGYVHRLARESERMLRATLSGDTKTMIEILEYAHNTEIPLLSYNNETDLTAVVNLVYLAARDYYRVEREDKAGIGYVDFIFYPVKRTEDSMILELKVGHTPEEAIQQIKDRKYALRFAGKSGEKQKYSGKILGVGICYDKETKKHSCKIEVLK